VADPEYELKTSRIRGTRVNRSAIEAAALGIVLEIHLNIQFVQIE